MIRLRGYWIRVHVRIGQSVRGLRWLNDIATSGKHELTDFGLMTQARFCFTEAIWAVTHFPDVDTARSWTELRRMNSERGD